MKQTNYIQQFNGHREDVVVKDLTVHTHKAYATRVSFEIVRPNHDKPIHYEQVFNRKDMVFVGIWQSRGAYEISEKLNNAIVIVMVDPFKAIDKQETNEDLIKIADEKKEDTLTGKYLLFKNGYTEHVYKDKNGKITEYLYQEENSGVEHTIRQVIFRPYEIWFDYGRTTPSLLLAITKRVGELKQEGFFVKEEN
jgi:hypothetical protein